MKKILFAATALAAALFASCDKDNDTINPALPETSDGARIAITLTGADEADTRAFFDASAKAESWESSLSSLSVFAFDNSGALIIRRDFTSSELASKIGDLRASQICGRHRVLILRRSELRRLVGQDPRSPYGPRGKVGCRL